MATKKKTTKAKKKSGKKNWGGARPGAGRPRIPDSERTFVAHRARPPHTGDAPVLVTMRLKDDLPSLKKPKLTRIVEAAVEAHRGKHRDEKTSFKIARVTIEDHVITATVEADDEEVLSRGIQGLMVRIARNLNPELGREGRLWADRYHARVVEKKSGRR